jgi:hypothetical protein
VSLVLGDVVEQLVARDPEEPRSKGASRRIWCPALDGVCNSKENILGNLARISLLEAASPGEPE